MFTGGTDNSGPLWCFVFPPAAIYLLGLRFGLAFSLVLTFPMIIFSIIRFDDLGLFEYPNSFTIRFLIAYLIETFLFYLVDSQKNKSQNDVKLLSGLIPICSKCKNIRDDQGYWNSLEIYIEKHSDVLFSHGMCSECSDELYGRESWYIKMKNSKKKGHSSKYP